MNINNSPTRCISDLLGWLDAEGEGTKALRNQVLNLHQHHVKNSNIVTSELLASVLHLLSWFFEADQWFVEWAIWPFRGPRQVSKRPQEIDGELGAHSNF
jgi:hypothetical protein